MNSGYLTITTGSVYSKQIAGSQPDSIVEAKVKWNNTSGSYRANGIAGDQSIAGSNGGSDKLAMFMTNPGATTVHSWAQMVPLVHII